MFNEKVFSTYTPDIIFVADVFANEFVGGAELTSQALIDSIPASLTIRCVKSSEVTIDLLKKFAHSFWIFGNFAGLNPNFVPSIIGNLRYAILEYDYKFCKYRSPEKHLAATGSTCDCHNDNIGKLVSTFFYGAMNLFWMSKKQMDVYVERFPFLQDRNNTILSSVFSSDTIERIRSLRQEQNENTNGRRGWLVLDSSSWIKGTDDCIQWCKDNQLEYEVIGNVTYETMLAKMARSEGMVYLPMGSDTCPRMVIEAKLLGCKLHLNDNVQHKDEQWFATDNVEAIESHLLQSPAIFWDVIQRAIDYKPSISGYVTTYNCLSQQYPIAECIESMKAFCSEICVVDGNSTDETLDVLAKLAYGNVDNTFVTALRLSAADNERFTFPDEFHGVRRNRAFKVMTVKRDQHPHLGVYDGEQKALARSMCTGEFCWQMDSDEVVHEDDAHKIYDLCLKFPTNVDVLSLPVIEYWGGPSKVRLDVTPWKWRLSRNKPTITHGVPKELCSVDHSGRPCALEGTDGCDMIDYLSREKVPHVSFYHPEADSARRAALCGNSEALQAYQTWFNEVVANLPCVFHYSWYNLARKIRLYRDFWSEHWNCIRGEEYVDSAEQNMMFDVPWSQVTDEMIDEYARLMADKLGGWIWHQKWDGVTMTPHMTCKRTQPSVMLRSKDYK